MTEKVSVVIVSSNRKDDLIECIDSFLASSYRNIEIIVVDNASRPPVLSWFPKKYKKIKLVTSDINLGAAEGRNRGLSESVGEYILFTDDDAIAGKDMITELVKTFAKFKNAGIVQPLVYDKQQKSILQGAGHDISLLTGRIKAWGVREIDEGQYEGVREVPMCGCVWMVKREVFTKIGNYDEDYFIPYEDSDFSIRARKSGYKLYCVSKAKTWHQGQKQTFVHKNLEWLGITSSQRAYRIGRNKIIFMRKHSPFPNNFVFFIIFLPGYAIIHTFIILSSLRLEILLSYWAGLLSGILYAIYYPLLSLRKIYQKIDKHSNFLKLVLMAWTEPIGWLINKSSKSILDVGSGQGLPMELIKLRIKPEYTVGIDLFEPYIKDAKQKKIHDKYVIADVKKLPFKKKSFDTVICLQVLEHLDKRDALALIRKMEQIAKKQVILATPIGEMYHPVVDNNPLQLHKSDFLPKEFEQLGYKVTKIGLKRLFGEEGIVHIVHNDIIRKLIFATNIIITPILFMIPFLNDYHLYAVKDLTYANKTN